MMQTLLWDDEVREAEFPELDEPATISAKELEMSCSSSRASRPTSSPTQFTDDYQEQLRTLVEAKLEQGDALDTEATFGERREEGGGEVIDLMEALRQARSPRKARPGVGRRQGRRDQASGGSKSASGSKAAFLAGSKALGLGRRGEEEGAGAEEERRLMTMPARDIR